MSGEYQRVFAELREAVKAAAHARSALDRVQSIDRLHRTLSAARELVRTGQLKTRADAARAGALRRGALYLEERDADAIQRASELLGDG